MPELPEVETICNDLEKIKNKKISKTFRSDKKMRFESSLDLQGLKNAEVTKISRRARYILINFDNDKTLIIHLGMSGRISLKNSFDKLKHDHFACQFSDGSWLIFNDPRRFGFVDLIKTKDENEHKMLKKLGVEPLSKDFDASHLLKKFEKKSMNIKTSLMDNEVVVGVGNIYANESLFDSKISPLRPANKISKKEAELIVSSIKKTLEKAIESKGSSINDYVDASGNLGNFQNNFKVYGRDKEKCLICKDAVRKITQNGRSTFYCPSCQK